MDKGLYEFLVREFEFIAENANQEEEIYTKEGIKKIFEFFEHLF